MLRTIILVSSICFVGCQTPTKWQREFLPKYHNGQVGAAICDLEKVKCEEIPQNNTLHSRNSVWILLNLATMQFASGAVKKASSNFKLALDALNYYSQPSSSDLTAQLAFEDTFSAYSGPTYEQTLARLYFALTLLEMGDVNNAEAILRQAEEFSSAKGEQNALCKYLFATLLEKRGDLSNANILYNQTSALLGSDVERGKDPNDATVIIVCHNGNAPFKYSSVAPASVASTMALEMFLSDYRRPIALSALPGIAVPALMKSLSSYPTKTKVLFANESKTLQPFFSVDHAAICTLEEEMPTIVARGIARYLMRRSTIYIANEQDQDLGALIDLGCLIANAATDADTRSWCTLPSEFDIAKFELPPGKQPFSLQVGNATKFCKELFLESGKIYVINIFNLHPNMTRVIT